MEVEACYKAFRRSVLNNFEIAESRFGVEPEITAKVAQRGVRIYETGISYHGRTYAQEKKTEWKDGIRAIWMILKYNIFNRLRIA